MTHVHAYVTTAVCSSAGFRIAYSIMSSLKVVFADRSRCAVSNGVRYYLIFVTLLWNAVEALTMYLLLVQVFHADISRYALKTGLVAWGQYTRCLGSVHSLLGASTFVAWGQYTRCLGSADIRCLGSVHLLLGVSTLVAWGQYTRCLGLVHSLLGFSTVQFSYLGLADSHCSTTLSLFFMVAAL